MKRLKAAAWLAVVGFVALPAILAAESYWEGSAARIREGEITQSGLLAASNTFPRATRIRVTNTATGATEVLTVVKRIDRATNVMLLVSAEASQKLGIGANDVVPVRISIAGEQGLPVEADPTERATSRDPDVNPSAQTPAQTPAQPRASVIQPSAASTEAAATPAATGTTAAAAASAAASTAHPAAAAEPQTQPAAQASTPAATEPTPREVGPQATAAAAAAPAQTTRAPAAATAAAAEPARQPAATQPQGETRQAAPQPQAAAAAEQPTTESAPPQTAAVPQAAPVQLPAATPEQDAEFLSRLAARTPETRAFAPPRGADAAPPVYAEETPQVSLEAATPTAAPPEVAPEAPSAPAVAGREAPQTTEVPAVETASATGAAAQEGPATLPARDLPFVQTEQPESAVTPPAGTPEPPATPPTRAAGAAAVAEASQPAAEGVAVTSPSETPLRERPFVQIEQPRGEVASAGAVPDALPTLPGPAGREAAVAGTEAATPEAVAVTAPSEPPAQERAFVQTEQPVASAASLAVAPAVPGAPAPRAAADDRAFVQTEQPIASAANLAVAPTVPGAPAPRAAADDRAFVQTEQPGAAAPSIALSPASPVAPAGREAAPPETAFVQREQPLAAPQSLDTVAVAPAPPPERATAAEQPGFAQTEQPATVAATPVAGEARPLADLRGFVQLEPLGAPPNALAYDALSPRLPQERAQAGAMVQTEQPRPEATVVAVETSPPQRETAAEIMSMVAAPSTPATTDVALAQAALPVAGGEEGSHAAPARLGRLSPIGSEEVVASLGSTTAPPPAAVVPPTAATAAPATGPSTTAATAEVTPGQHVTETVVALTPTEPVPPPARTGGMAAASTGGTAAPAAATAPPAAATSAPVARAPAATGPSPAALLSAAVARAGLPLNAYYLQVAAVASERLAKDLLKELAKKYPSSVIPPDEAERTVYRVLVGPLAADERGAVLYQLRAGGYPDAFIRYLN